ncbi:MAG: hypothetical protein CTY14_08415 [Methylotenera sp.]|nr:MAG: hypothetical protein CTY14_08415 [Methylotenera sp.]
MNYDDSDLLSSSWLIYMLAKSSDTPEGRLLSLFDILNDWLKAPNMLKHCHLSNANHSLLLDYCITQAQTLGAENPEILAEHIVLIARNAAQQNITHPSSNSLTHAKKAASALILAQTQPVITKSIKPALSKPVTYSIAATLALAVCASLIWAPFLKDQQSTEHVNAELNKDNTLIVAKKDDQPLTAHDATQMYAKYELMRQGTCQFPEALLMPDKHKAIYLDNVVGGKLPSNLEDLAIANDYLEKVKCNFTPMLMAASK